MSLSTISVKFNESYKCKQSQKYIVIKEWENLSEKILCDIDIMIDLYTQTHVFIFYAMKASTSNIQTKLPFQHQQSGITLCLPFG